MPVQLQPGININKLVNTFTTRVELACLDEHPLPCDQVRPSFKSQIKDAPKLCAVHSYFEYRTNL